MSAATIQKIAQGYLSDGDWKLHQAVEEAVRECVVSEGLVIDEDAIDEICEDVEHAWWAAAKAAWDSTVGDAAAIKKLIARLLDG